MIRFSNFVSAICISLLILLGGESVLAQSQGGDPGQSGQSHGRFYGKGQPESIWELPPGQLRNDLKQLPAKARGRAMAWLQGVSFPEEDVRNLRVSADGSISFADTVLPNAENAEVVTAGSEILGEAVNISQVFRLHSRPGASNVLFLDFDGHTIEGTAWNSGGNKLVALPFDPSGNDNPATVANFTQVELDRIAIIWHRMAEDFAAFDIDITTEEPPVFTPTTGRVLFTHDSDASGQAMPSQNAGGTAFLNVFGWNDYTTKYSPAFVYYSNLSGVATYNAEAGSHEFGHNIGLSHDGVIDGDSYYTGSGSGEVDWAPIMGNAYYAIVTPWSKGEYANANNTEDDLAILAEDLGYAGDDHGDSAAFATPLVVEANGDILVSSPEFDPDNLLPENKGIIDDSTDVDWFFLDVADGSLNITATPAWHSFGYTAHRGANLDIELALFDFNGDLVISDEPIDRTNASVIASLSAGRYYLRVAGVGNDTNSDYSDYASMGMYFLEGSVQVGAGGDSTAPSPVTMSWQIAPRANDSSSISMTAVEATDDSGIVEYLFTCVAGGNGCTNSGWQSSPSYTATGLEASTFYSFKVTARDGFGNKNGDSPSVGDTTDAPDAQPPLPVENTTPVAVVSYAPGSAIITKGKTASVILDGSASFDPDGSIQSWSWESADGKTIVSGEVVTVNLQEGTHEFTLSVTDNNGATGTANLIVSVTKSGDGGGGGGKPCNPRKQACG